MSVQDTDDPKEVTEVDNSEAFAERLGLDSRYTPVVREPVSGYGPLVDSWVRMEYPLNVDQDGQHGVIQGLGVRHAVQYPDGSGVYETTAGSRLYAIRTAGGVIVWNNFRGDPWPYTAEGRGVLPEFEVPFNFVGYIVEEQTDMSLHHADSILARGAEGNVVDGDMFMRGVVSVDVIEESDHLEDEVSADRGALIEHKDGVQVFIGYDETAHGHGLFGFVPFDGHQGVRTPSAADALDLLRPDEALAAEKRQGEWFIVLADDSDAQGTIQKPGVGERPYGGSPLDNHVPREWKTRIGDHTFVRRVVSELSSRHDPEEMDAEMYAIHYLTDLEYDDLESIGVFWQDSPQDIFDKIHDGEIELSYERARELAGGIYVRGTIRHRENDHRMAKTEEWAQAVTHDQEVITVDDTDQATYHVD